MSRIVITLNKTDIANILFGGEISMTPNVSKLDNLQQVIIKQEDLNVPEWNHQREESVRVKNMPTIT